MYVAVNETRKEIVRGLKVFDWGYFNDSFSFNFYFGGIDLLLVKVDEIALYGECVHEIKLYKFRSVSPVFCSLSSNLFYEETNSFVPFVFLLLRFICAKG